MNLYDLLAPAYWLSAAAVVALVAVAIRNALTWWCDRNSNR